MTHAWPWIALGLLGALHGVNPGMGWLFAVALGLQQGERRAIWRALVPLTIGHALAIAAAVTAAGMLGLIVPAGVVRWLVVVALALLGVRQLQRHRHPSAGGMRVGARELVAWSFLVATAHGAGLMAVPLAARTGAELHGGISLTNERSATRATSPSMHSHHQTPAPHHAAVLEVSTGTIAATLVHTIGYLLVTGMLALVVYERAGLRLLRRAWINIDRLWALSLLLTAVALAVMARLGV